MLSALISSRRAKTQEHFRGRMNRPFVIRAKPDLVKFIDDYRKESGFRSRMQVMYCAVEFALLHGLHFVGDTLDFYHSCGGCYDQSQSVSS